LERAELVSGELSKITRDEQRRRHHHHEPAHGDPDLDGRRQDENETQDESERSDSDASSEMRVEIGAGHLIDELGIVLREPAFDLVQDLLFVIRKGHGSCLES